MKHILKIALLGLALLLVTLKASALSGGPIDGQVLDESTDKPVADAIVVATWTGDHSNLFASGNSVCYHAETARTDVNGNYHIPAWSLPWRSSEMLMSTRPFVLQAYKAGYTWSKSHRELPGTVLIAPFAGTKDEYFDHLVRAMTSCSGAGESEKNLYRLHSAVASDAKAMAETTEQKKRAESLAIRADFTLVDERKPTGYDSHGRWGNIDPKDSFKKEELLE